MKTYQKGFTLLEVLFSGFILFAILTTTTMVYRGALLSSSKAERSVEISSSVPSIKAIISDTIRNEKFNGNPSGVGMFGPIKFEWRAVLSHTGKPSPFLQLSSDSAYYLWDIELILTYGTVRRDYLFKELNW